MTKSTISPKYQIVIPKKIRKSLQLKPGQKVHVIQSAHRIELIPEKPLSEMRGFLKGIDTGFLRNGDRL